MNHYEYDDEYDEGNGVCVISGETADNVTPNSDTNIDSGADSSSESGTGFDDAAKSNEGESDFVGALSSGDDEESGGEDLDFDLACEDNASDFDGDLGGREFAGSEDNFAGDRTNDGNINNSSDSTDGYEYNYDYIPDPTEGAARNPFQSDSMPDTNNYTDGFLNEQHDFDRQIDNPNDDE